LPIPRFQLRSKNKIEIRRTGDIWHSAYNNSKIWQTEINVGEAAFKLKQDGIVDVIFIRRAGSEKSVRAESAGNYKLPPLGGLI